jgi:beta-glucosidase
LELTAVPAYVSLPNKQSWRVTLRYRIEKLLCPLFMLAFFSAPGMAGQAPLDLQQSKKIAELISKMTLAEKLGQMFQVSGASEQYQKWIRAGLVGSVINVVDPSLVRKLQIQATQKSRLGIPLLIGRDVIHGFRTIFPIPLGQAASFNPQLVQQAAQIAAREASSVGINWTFAPMIDIARDPRWGRVAESLGEDPYLVSQMAKAMVLGLQGKLQHPETIAACAKHFVAYGAAEGGRDYNTVNLSHSRLRNVYLPPFQTAVDSGVASIMTAFNEINGVPATANRFVLDQVLRQEFEFAGVVLSDWAAMTNMIDHGYAADEKQVALQSILAQVDMEMVSQAYRRHLEHLLAAGTVDIDSIDRAVRRILRLKFKLGLFEQDFQNDRSLSFLQPDALAVARRLASQSIVMLKNKDGLLPLRQGAIEKLVVAGPLAQAPHEQLGTWAFDGNSKDSLTPARAIANLLGKERVPILAGLSHSRDKRTDGFGAVIEAAKDANAVLLVLGEESILSGEAHCRAHLDLPGAQAQLVHSIADNAQGVPLILVVMAGRPLCLGSVIDRVDAILYVWHPGTMGGAAIGDMLFGLDSPSGRLPITFPVSVGQIPIYYAHKNTGRPPTGKEVMLPDIKVGAFQTSLGNRSYYLDAGVKPQYPFGYGLTYGSFVYDRLTLGAKTLLAHQPLRLRFRLHNRGKHKATETIQVYIRDRVASLTRPIKELVHFQRVTLAPGESRLLPVQVPFERLSFTKANGQRIVEPGEFDLWVGPDAQRGQHTTFVVLSKKSGEQPIELSGGRKSADRR